MKKILCLFFTFIITLTASSCGNGSLSDKEMEELCSWRWESYIDVMQFTRNGRILRNFQFLHESDSCYIIKDNKITMYAEDYPDDAMTFDFRMEDDKIYIGDLEYKKLEKADDPSLEVSKSEDNGAEIKEEK